MIMENFGEYPHRNGKIVSTSISIDGKRSFLGISVECTSLHSAFSLQDSSSFCASSSENLTSVKSKKARLIEKQKRI